MPTLFLAALALVCAVPPGAQSDVTALYAKGITWEVFLANADARKETWQLNTRRARPSADVVARLKTVSNGLTVLAIAEASCSDSVNTLPYLAKLVAEAGVEMRIVGKNAATSVMDRHRTPDGRSATPTFVLLRDGREIGAFVERPATLQNWFIAMQSLSIAERVERKQEWYDWERGDQTLEEIVALAERHR